MRSTIYELTKDLEYLRILVDSIEPVNSALAGHQNPHVKQYVLIRRRFDYAAFIVALYASFEKYIENLVLELAKLAARHVPYNKLPDKLQERHLSQTLDLLKRPDYRLSRYPGFEEFDAVKNLYECLKGVKTYRLNEPAIIEHTANLRPAEINKLFHAIGVDAICNKACKAEPMLEWFYAPADLLSIPLDDVPYTIVDSRINEIIGRRNQVAHRGGQPDNLLGTDEMLEAIGFIEAFSKSIFVIAAGRYLQYYSRKRGLRVRLQQRQNDGPYSKGKVVIIRKVATRLFIGQPVFVITDPAGARWGRIQSIRVGDIDVQAFEPQTMAPKGIGIRLNFKCPKGSDLIALTTEDDVLWD